MKWTIVAYALAHHSTRRQLVMQKQRQHLQPAVGPLGGRVRRMAAILGHQEAYATVPETADRSQGRPILSLKMLPSFKYRLHLRRRASDAEKKPSGGQQA